MILKVNVGRYFALNLPLILAEGQSVKIDWGDGKSDTYDYIANQGNDRYRHDYDINNIPLGEYTVTISGTATALGTATAFEVMNGDSMITRVESFGELGLKSLAGAFFGTTALTYVCPTIPRTVTNTSRMFMSSLFNGDNISDWVVRNVTDMNAMFADAGYFNGDISGWDVSNVKKFQNMFNMGFFLDGNGMPGIAAFNRDISSWKVNTTSQLDRMFFYARKFDQDLSSWKCGGLSDTFNASAMDGKTNKYPMVIAP